MSKSTMNVNQIVADLWTLFNLPSVETDVADAALVAVAGSLGIAADTMAGFVDDAKDAHHLVVKVNSYLSSKEPLEEKDLITDVNQVRRSTEQYIRTDVLTQCHESARPEGASGAVLTASDRERIFEALDEAAFEGINRVITRRDNEVIMNLLQEVQVAEMSLGATAEESAMIEAKRRKYLAEAMDLADASGGKVTDEGEFVPNPMFEAMRLAMAREVIAEADASSFWSHLSASAAAARLNVEALYKEQGFGKHLDASIAQEKLRIKAVAALMNAAARQAVWVAGDAIARVVFTENTFEGQVMDRDGKVYTVSKDAGSTIEGLWSDEVALFGIHPDVIREGFAEWSEQFLVALDRVYAARRTIRVTRDGVAVWTFVRDDSQLALRYVGARNPYRDEQNVLIHEFMYEGVALEDIIQDRIPQLAVRFAQDAKSESFAGGDETAKEIDWALYS